jgi:hypothetical protein
VFEALGPKFLELLITPFRRADMVWAIVPLYFGWIVNELTSSTSKASYRTAIQTGFGFMWAGAQWVYQYMTTNPGAAKDFNLRIFLAVNVTVTVLVLIMGVAAFVCGIRKRYPKYGNFLGHTRFSNYFMITIFPMQSGILPWSWERLVAILAFAVPIWMLFHFGLKPLRK